MNIRVRYETVPRMLKLCSDLVSKTLDRQELEELLEHEDYGVEFARYEGRVSKEEYIDYFINFFDIDSECLENRDLKGHHDNYKYLFDNLHYYVKEAEKLNHYIADLFKRQVDIALAGLPEDITFEELQFLFTISIGRSFGWVYENTSHFDVIQLVRNYCFDSFISAIAHEVHHIGMNKIYQGIDMDSLPLEGHFYLCFSGEGLACKYCNNAQGVLSKSIYQEPSNIGLDKFSWAYLNGDFEETYLTFKDHINRIRSNKIATREKLDQIVHEYWMNDFTEDQDRSEVPKLKHFRLYSLGNDIWGLIHDVFGKEIVYQTLRNPMTFPEVYNAALIRIGRTELTI